MAGVMIGEGGRSCEINKSYVDMLLALRYSFLARFFLKFWLVAMLVTGVSEAVFRCKAGEECEAVGVFAVRFFMGAAVVVGGAVCIVAVVYFVGRTKRVVFCCHFLA